MFFWGALALIGGGYAGVYSKVEPVESAYKYLIFIGYLGFFYNLILSSVLRGSKKWQEYWEKLVEELEGELNNNHSVSLKEKLGILNLKIDNCKDDKEKEKLQNRHKNLEAQLLKHEANPLKIFSPSKRIHKEIRRASNNNLPPIFRPKQRSVSKLKFILSDITMFFWVFLICKDWFQFCISSEFRNLKMPSSIYFTSFIVPVLSVLIFWLMIRYHQKYRQQIEKEVTILIIVCNIFVIVYFLGEFLSIYSHQADYYSELAVFFSYILMIYLPSIIAYYLVKFYHLSSLKHH